ncbi:hypothetical protein [Desulfobacter latus]|uniref:ExoI SH3-like domain-containing protein n=1 Tax=Desulfobacter latus TaxID=2292 RepID=A0A850TBE9_9BACT|nr:hypothetical protein [Desulfobacter latus]
MVYVSSFTQAEYNCATIIVSVAKHPAIANKFIYFDLRYNPRQWFGVNPEKEAVGQASVPALTNQL